MAIQISSSVSSYGKTVTIPSGLTEGDLMVVHLNYLFGTNHPSSTDFSAPSGWTSIDTNVGVNPNSPFTRLRAHTYYKVADSSDVSSSGYSFSIVGDNYYWVNMRVTGDFLRSGPISVHNSAGTGNITSPWTPTCAITPPDANSFLFAIPSTYLQVATAYSIATSNPTWTNQLTSGYAVVFTATRSQTTSTGNPTVTYGANDACVTLITFAVVPTTPVVITPSAFAVTSVQNSSDVEFGLFINPQGLTTTFNSGTAKDVISWTPQEKGLSPSTDINLLDSYGVENQLDAGDYYICNNTGIPFGLGDGQTFQLENDSIITSCKFNLRFINTPTGPMSVKLYNTVGTYGVNALPDGDALAESDSIDISDITDTLSLVEFTFSGSNRIVLSKNVTYAVVVEYDGPASLGVGFDQVNLTHPGNWVFKQYDGSWDGDQYSDLIFYLYGELAESSHTQWTAQLK